MANLSAMTFETAHDQYVSNISHAHNLIHVHRLSKRKTDGKSPRGKRGPQTSINRAIVLMAVATWQAAVEDLALAAFHFTPAAQDQSRVNVFVNEIEKFATPDSRRTRGLIARNVMMPASSEPRFDPVRAWSWKTWAGRNAGQVGLDAQTIAGKLDSWVGIRHAVAHGHDDLFSQFSSITSTDTSISWASQASPPTSAPGVPVVDGAKVVSRNARKGGAPTLTLEDSEQCLTFFNKLTKVTAQGLMSYVNQITPSREAMPWNVIGKKRALRGSSELSEF